MSDSRPLLCLLGIALVDGFLAGTLSLCSCVGGTGQ